MGRLKAASMTLACAVALALGLAACGGGDDLLPGKTAEQINQNLDQVRAAADEGDCAGAESAVTEVREQVDGLGGVDQKLKAALRQGTNRLGEVVAACSEQALAEEETEREAEEEERAEQEEQAAVEAEEEELAEESEDKKDQKAEKEAEREQQAAEKEAEKEEAETPESEAGGQGNGNGPPAETPSGNEPPAGGVGPGTEVE